MKTLNDYLALSYRMEIVKDSDEGGFVASSSVVAPQQVDVGRGITLSKQPVAADFNVLQNTLTAGQDLATLTLNTAVNSTSTRLRRWKNFKSTVLVLLSFECG